MTQPENCTETDKKTEKTETKNTASDNKSDVAGPELDLSDEFLRRCPKSKLKELKESLLKRYQEDDEKARKATSLKEAMKLLDQCTEVAMQYSRIREWELQLEIEASPSRGTKVLRKEKSRGLEF